MVNFQDAEHGLDFVDMGRVSIIRLFLVFAVAFNQLAAGLAHAGMLAGHDHMEHGHVTVASAHDHSTVGKSGGHQHHQALEQGAKNEPASGIPDDPPTNGEHKSHACCAAGFGPCGVILPLPVRVPEPAELTLASGLWRPVSPTSWRNAPLLRPPIFLS